jgi:hypothetical protein
MEANINESNLYEPYQQTVEGITIKFLVDNAKKCALFETIEFNMVRVLTPQMIIKFFCLLMRNCISSLMDKGVTMIYHYVIKEEYEEFKNKTTWEIVPFDLSYAKQLYNSVNFANNDTIFLCCKIAHFAENMATALEIELK